MQQISLTKEHKIPNDHYLDKHMRANAWKPSCKNKHEDWGKKTFTKGG